jgi:NAD(P)-dependent dehydrogenase (short-subunit alcohol dehydrogenase family)
MAAKKKSGVKNAGAGKKKAAKPTKASAAKKSRAQAKKKTTTKKAPAAPAKIAPKKIYIAPKPKDEGGGRLRPAAPSAAAAPTKRGPKYKAPDLTGKIAVVAGATRGAGRGIALGLGEAGAIVYCTGRSVRGEPATAGRPETIEETAEMVSERGGVGIPVRADHTRPEQVENLFKQIKIDRGRLDILVNDVWGGDQLTQFGTPFWALDLEKGSRMMRQAIYSHIVTARCGVPLMLEGGHPGVIIEITDGDTFGYRGNLFYDLVKTSVIRLAFAMSRELRRKNIAAVAVTPGFLRSEAMLENFGVSEANWKDAAKKEADFIASETPLFVGRAVAALAADKKVMKKSGRVFSSWELSEEYKFPDADGRQPNWGKHFEKKYGKVRTCDAAFYKYWFEGPMELAYPDWP